MTKHEPIQPEKHSVMNTLAKAIDTAINGSERHKQWGFVLLVFPFGDPAQDRINYIGNGKREEVLVAIKELAARWEGCVTETETKQ